MRTRAIRSTLATAAVLAACSDRPPTTALEADGDGSAAAAPSTATPAGPSLYSDRAHALLADAFELLSDPAERDLGRYRFRTLAGEYPAVVRDDFIVAELENGDAVVRRVLERRIEGGDLVLETGPGYWHEIVRGGTYSVTVGFNGDPAAAPAPTGPQAAPIPLEATALELPSLLIPFSNVDGCFWIHLTVAQICGQEKDVEVGPIEIKGTLDSLRIIDGSIRFTGDMDLDLTVDPGGISGGRPPVFEPCNRGNHLGCVTTPTGAALIEFLRRYAPAIPEASLPAIRICIPGTPVRVQRGYWSGFTWTPPVWEQCRITDTGALPTVTLPAIQAARTEFRPHLQGHMTVRARGDGMFALKIPIPGAAVSRAYGTDDLSIKVELGPFIYLSARLKDAGGTVHVTFNDRLRVAQSWDPNSGWSEDLDIFEKSNSADLLDVDPADSITIRVGAPVDASVTLCLAVTGCPTGPDSVQSKMPKSLVDRALSLLEISLGAGVGVNMFTEAFWTREQVHPTDPLIDNWHIALEGGYEVSLNAKLAVPLSGWILPDVPLEWEPVWEFARFHAADVWGQGNLAVTTTTTGTPIGVDGYTVIVERADTLPPVHAEGSQLLLTLPGLLRTGASDLPIEPNGVANFGGPSTLLPCTVRYSDQILYAIPIVGVPFGIARSAGVGVPTYAVASACPWLIARYNVSLTGVPANCTVQDGAVRNDVWLQQLDVIRLRPNLRVVAFEVECSDPPPPGTTGSLTVNVPDLPFDQPPIVLVDGVHAGVVPESGSLTLDGLTPGTKEVRLTRVEPQCAPDAEDAAVVADAVTTVDMSVVACTLPPPPQGSVTYQTTLNGPGTDPSGYHVVVNGVSAAALPVEGRGTVTDLAVQTPTVFVVADIDPACQPLGANPRLVTLDAGGTPVSVPFPVRCIDAAPDTLIGSVDATGWPIPTVTLRAPDGRTLQVNGPKTSELARLSGAAVRAWGQVSATGINVHGYDLRLTPDEERWLGIVLDRSDGTWLMGDEAVRLVDAPASLKAAAGNFVWVVGRLVPGGVRTTLFGVIRPGAP